MCMMSCTKLIVSEVKSEVNNFQQFFAWQLSVKSWKIVFMHVEMQVSAPEIAIKHCEKDMLRKKLLSNSTARQSSSLLK